MRCFITGFVNIEKVSSFQNSKQFGLICFIVNRVGRRFPPTRFGLYGIRLSYSFHMSSPALSFTQDYLEKSTFLLQTFGLMTFSYITMNIRAITEAKMS